MNTRKNLLAIAATTTLAGSMLVSVSANAASGMLDGAAKQTLSTDTLGKGCDKRKEGKCGEGKCGEGKCGGKEGKCGEGKCGGKEGKCGEGKCGSK